MNTYLYRIQPVNLNLLTSGGTEEEERLVGEHFQYLKKLTESGILLLAGRTLNTDESSFGIVIFNAESESEALQVMNNDPAVKNGVFKSKLFPFAKALVSKEILED